MFWKARIKVIMRRSPIGSITCSIKGPFVRASAARGEDIYLSQTFYSRPIFTKYLTFYINLPKLQKYIYPRHFTPRPIFAKYLTFLHKVAESLDIYLSQTFYSSANPRQIFNFFYTKLLKLQRFLYPRHFTSQQMFTKYLTLTLESSSTFRNFCITVILLQDLS